MRQLRFDLRLPRSRALLPKIDWQLHKHAQARCWIPEALSQCDGTPRWRCMNSFNFDSRSVYFFSGPQPIRPLSLLSPQPFLLPLSCSIWGSMPVLQTTERDTSQTTDINVNLSITESHTTYTTVIFLGTLQETTTVTVDLSINIHHLHDRNRAWKFARANSRIITLFSVSCKRFQFQEWYSCRQISRRIFLFPPAFHLLF